MDNEKLFPKQPTRDVRFEKPTFIDPLTSLFNRYYLYEFLPQEIKKSQASNYSLGVFIMDIDNFKGLNDKYGHLVGDAILRQFSDFLRKSRRQTDMVIRYAGDEFIILLPGVDRQTGLILGKRLIEEIKKVPFKAKDNEEVHLTVSIGLSLCPSDATDIDRLIDLADKAMYLSKERGRNQISSAEEVTLETAASQIAMDYFPCPKFVNREQEMGTLKQVFNNTVLGKGFLEAAFISADRGVGRSRLLSEFNDYAKDKAVVIKSKGAFKHKQEPYYLFVSCLDDYLNKIGVNSLKARQFFSALPAEELAELGKLLSGIKKVPGGSYSPGKQARSLLFRALLDLLMAISKNSALLLSFDDMQWADDASLELVYYLIKHEKKRKIFAVLSFQTMPELDKKEESRIKQLLNYLHAAENVIDIKLSNLTQRQTYEMVEGMFPHLKQLRELNNFIFDTTKGNPAFVDEIFKSLAENKLLVYKDNAWQLDTELESIDIPHSLGETVRKRLKGLDTETKELIVQAAVVGNDFSVDILRKIGEKNEGYIFELMSRARKKHLVEEKDEKGNFSFISGDIQNALYAELSETERKALHQKIGQVFAKEHKDDLYNVAADLSFHFGKVGGSAMAAKYSRLIQQKADALFNPAEVVDYLKEIALEPVPPEQKEVKVELAPPTTLEIDKVIKILQSAVKNFQLYPADSSIRANFVQDIYQGLCKILEETPRLEIIESEGVLVINGKRISSREAQRFGGEDLISLLIEANLKSVSFIQDITQEEINTFLQNLSQGREEIKDKGGWKSIVQERGLNHIKINEFSYDQVLKPTLKKPGERKKFKDAMMTEFLLGKIGQNDVDSRSIVSKISQEPEKFAQAMNKVAENVGKQGGSQDALKSVIDGIKRINSQISQADIASVDTIDKLSKVVLELDWKLKNKFIRSKPEITGLNRQNITDEIINNLPDTEIINLIEQSFRHGSDNPLVMKDLVDKVLPDKARREKILPHISAKLSKLGMEKEIVDCVSGKSTWETLSIEKRSNILLTLPADEFETSDIKLFSEFLEELLNKKKTSDIKNLLERLVVKAANAEPQIRQKIDGVIGGFIGGESNISGRAQPLLEILKTETKRGVYIYILNIVKHILECFVKNLDQENLYSALQAPKAKAYFIAISEVFDVLQKRLMSQNLKDVSIHECIRDFISDAFNFDKFLEIFVLASLEHFRISPKHITQTLGLFSDKSAEVLVDMCLHRKEIAKDSFEGYVMRKRISGALKEMGDAVLDKLKQGFLQEKQKENISLLLELSGHQGKEELVASIEPYLYHEDLELRRQAILALGAIDTKKTNDILLKISRSAQDNQIRLFAKKVLTKKKVR